MHAEKQGFLSSPLTVPEILTLGLTVPGWLEWPLSCPSRCTAVSHWSQSGSCFAVFYEYPLFCLDFLVAQSVKNLTAVQETQVRSLGREDPLEKEMANHSGILAWKIPWTEDPGGCSPWLAKSPTRLNDFTVFILLYGGVGR